MTTLFDRLDARRPPAEQKTNQPDHAQLLLDFLQRWAKPTISSRDIHNFGPKIIRKERTMVRSAQILVAQGWLIPLAAHKWQVVRKMLTPTQ